MMYSITVCAYLFIRKEDTLAELYPTDRESLERDCDLEFFIASGPGGQHRNKVEMAARLEERQKVSKPRRATRPTTASRVRRLEAKRHVSTIKKQRSAPSSDS